MLRGGKKIAGAERVVKSILTPFNHIDQKNCMLPFTFLTNGGGIPEAEKAQSIANIVFENNEKDYTEIPKEKTIMCHTPFSQPSMVEKYKDSFVLVTGLGRMVEIADDHYGFNKAIEIEELWSLFPESCPSISSDIYLNTDNSHRDMVKDKLMKRFGKKGYSSVEKLKADLKFDAIFLLSDAVNLEMNI